MCKFYKLPFKYHLTLSAFYTISLSCEKALTNLWKFTHTHTHMDDLVFQLETMLVREKIHTKKNYILNKKYIYS